jgi:hypothetical protein
MRFPAHWLLPCFTQGGEKVQMLLVLFFILLVMWAMGFLAFHVAGGLIHLLLLFALISLIMHLFTARTV